MSTIESWAIRLEVASDPKAVSFAAVKSLIFANFVIGEVARCVMQIVVAPALVAFSIASHTSREAPVWLMPRATSPGSSREDDMAMRSPSLSHVARMPSFMNLWYASKDIDVFVLDFQNDTDSIAASFALYYRTTLLSAETDPNKLHDLKSDLDGSEVYNDDEVGRVVDSYLGGAERDKLDPTLDGCVARYKEALDEDGQVDFKGKAKAFVRTYDFLASILPFKNVSWEKLSLFLHFLVPKPPAPKEEDLSKGVLESVDMESYRLEKRAAMRITLTDENAEVGPVPTAGGGHKPEPELDLLSRVIRSFNELYGNIEWVDMDRVHNLVTKDIPTKVAADEAYQNARANSDEQNARVEHDKALQRVMNGVMSDDTQLFTMFLDNLEFRRRPSDTAFKVTYRGGAAPATPP